MSETKYQLRNLVIPDYVYQDNNLNWTSARVYAFIHSYTNPFFFGNEHLAQMFGVHEQTISTALSQLEKLGYIRTTHTPKAGGGEFRLCEDAQPSRAKSLSRQQNSDPTVERNHSGKDIKVNNIKGNFNTISHSEAKEQDSGSPEKLYGSVDAAKEKFKRNQERKEHKNEPWKLSNMQRPQKPKDPEVEHDLILEADPTGENMTGESMKSIFGLLNKLS